MYSKLSAMFFITVGMMHAEQSHKLNPKQLQRSRVPVADAIVTLIKSSVCIVGGSGNKIINYILNPIH